MANPASLSSKKGIVPLDFFLKSLDFGSQFHLLNLDSSASIGMVLFSLKEARLLLGQAVIGACRKVLD